MKSRYVKICFLFIMISIITTMLYACTRPITFQVDGISSIAVSHQGSFYVNVNDEPQETFLKGVNLGATIPGYFPGHLAISKETYLRWFDQIYDMNANVIRVYTTMRPIFYEALHEFNEGKEQPLYVLQGVWINEDYIKNLNDAYAEDGQIIEAFISDTKDLIDIFHGDKILPVRPGFASGTYTADISDYVIGWILGLEWGPDFVIGTNENNAGMAQFSGDYLYTKRATPFEIFLAEVGDTILQYEAETYQMTRPLSLTNWLTTDMLTHSNEPDEDEDKVSVNTEHIKTKNTAFAGMFASYHVYPYYPEFMNYEPEYLDWIDPKTGSPNPYKAYINDLIDAHDMPVLIAEFGLPSSRGVTHLNPDGYNQGGFTEEEQADRLMSLLTSIHETDAMGALIFSWQDEWFKRTWNTMDFDLAWRRPYWSNVETNEQFFGLLAMDPDAPENMHHVDGNLSDWENIDPISETDQQQLYVDSDERYLYITLKDDAIDWSNQTVYIPIDTIPNQGNNHATSEQLTYTINADFMIIIDGVHDSRIMVDAYYDATNYLYANVLDMITDAFHNIAINSGIYTPIHHVLNAEFTLPETQNIIPFNQYEAGLLTYGNSHPLSHDYDSLADFYFGDSFVEIRIPWLLLNVMDPSTKQIISDFHTLNEDVFVPMTATGFYFEALIKTNQETITMPVGMYDWDEWHEVMYYERLKQAYYDVQEAFLYMN